MRDILYKNLTSQDHHRRDIFLSETFVQHGVTTMTQKHFIYPVQGHSFIDKPAKLQAWIKKFAGKGPRLKDLSVLKTYDSKMGEEKFEVKIMGNLYVLREQALYNVDFTQVFKIDRRGENLKFLE